jgi:hypothetical protein
MAKCHSLALEVGVDLVLDPPTPIRVGQGDTLRLFKADIVFGA